MFMEKYNKIKNNKKHISNTIKTSSKRNGMCCFLLTHREGWRIMDVYDARKTAILSGKAVRKEKRGNV